MNSIKNIVSNIRFYYVVVSLTAIWLVIKYNNLKQEATKIENENKVLKKQTDSLNQEIFVKDIMIGSYEVMWGRLEEINPELANKIDLEVE